MMQSSQERLDNDVANGLGLISDKLVHEGGFWGVIGELNDNLANFGFAVVGIFIASWIVSPWSDRAPDAANPASYQSYVNWSAAIGARDLLAARPVAAT
jgi:hypothetical protein